MTFTGAIAARYDMPIANEGDTGRIVAVYVEAGDHVKRGQILAKIDDSVLVQQVNRLSASLEQARAQAALSAAEYKRALGVEAAGALSAEDIEKRRATSVTDAANVKVVAAQLPRRGRASSARASPPRSRARCSRATPRSARSPTPAARPCSASRAAARWRCAARSPSRTWRQVKVGQAATVYLTGVDAALQGHGAAAGRGHRSGDAPGRHPHPAQARPHAAPRRLRAREVAVDKAQRPVLPQTAVIADSNGSYVLIVNADNKVERHAVRVSGVTESRRHHQRGPHRQGARGRHRRRLPARG